MKGFWYGLSISLAFIIGCVAAPLIVPPLTAQNTAAGAQRWEYMCASVGGVGMGTILDNLTTDLGRLGAEGWELATHQGSMFCMKRPL